MAVVRWLAIVCCVFAGIGLARADTEPPIFPPPSAAPPPPPAPPIKPPAPRPPPAPPQSAKQKAAADRAQAETVCATHSPDCNWLDTLGGLERQSMRRALAARGYELEPEPWGKIVGKIRVYNEDVFAEKNRLLRFFNHFHVTSKESVVRAEVILRPGEVWNQAKIEETARRLRDPIFTSVIAVVPVKSAAPGTVDVLVVTRDIWSLRLNTAYTFQSGTLTDLSTSLSENNFLGRRVLVAAAMTMDQGALSTGPLFIDKNFLGQHLELRVRVNAILTRGGFLHDENPLFPDTGPLPQQQPPSSFAQTGAFDLEGTSSTISLTRPLWNLGAKWGGGVNWTHRDAIDRRFFGIGLRPVWCPLGSDCVATGFDPNAVPTDELLPWKYGMKRWAVSANVVRSFGTDYKQNVSFAYGVDSTRPYLLDSFPGLVDQREPFRARVLPRSEFVSIPSISYGMYTPRYKTRRNVGTYDLAEDLRTGPTFEASVGVSLKALGSDNTFWRGAVSGGWVFPWCREGSVSVSAGVATRHQDGEFIDNAASGSVSVVTPVYRYGRIVAESSIGTRWNDTQNAFLTIGSDNGLRGFRINEFAGERLTGTQIEFRTLPKAIWVFRVGGVLFYDLGGAAASFQTMQLHHDIGIGLRSLIPQTSRELFRFDLAFPLDGDQRFHPKFIAGFRSEF
jgi:hypothetical protein